MTIDASTHARRCRSVTVVTVAALAGGVAAGAYEYSAPENRSPVSTGTQATAERPGGDAGGSGDRPPSFTDADRGTCITWDTAPDGRASNFSRVDCATPHRFEVATREDLSAYPTSEFGPTAAMPDKDRQARLTAELCEGPTMSYLNGALDPEGRYSISPILPPVASWEKGDRTMLCGVMVPDAAGRAQEVQGLAAEQDQSRAFPEGTCVRVDGELTTEVPCQEDHAWQVVSVVTLGQQFPDGWPPVEQQNDYLNGVCTKAAMDYIGGDDALYQSTLAPFWTTLQQQSWDAGSRTVNCALTKGDPGGGFATLNGDVTQGFTIDGAPPPPQPPRNPVRR